MNSLTTANAENEACYLAPEHKLPVFKASQQDLELLTKLSEVIASGDWDKRKAVALNQLFATTCFSPDAVRLILILYSPGHKRILISRTLTKAGQFSEAVAALLDHPRCALLAQTAFRLQLDFIQEPFLTVDFYRIGMHQSGKRHFEIGVDGLMIIGSDQKLHFFLPGDAYVRSLMSMSQLRHYLHNAYGEDYLRQARFKTFRSLSYLSSPNTWLQLYRGLPLIGAVCKQKLEHSLTLAIEHIQRTQKTNGQFLYYYDAANDSFQDHEHPKRDPAKNPYYNILRHCGGALTCIYYEKYQRQDQSFEIARKAINYLLQQTRFTQYQDRQAAYIFSEQKAKLGGSGIGLYLLADYQLVTGDTRYQAWADQLAWHLINQITASGEFIYYNIYLDQPITEAQNHQYFSFYYPGEAVCGLAKYLHLLSPAERKPYFDKLKLALKFLLEIRPHTRASEYTAVPSDSWLMMGIMELWDFPQMRQPSYAEFVFNDAQQMLDHMYKVTDAPYPDYAGAFYYQFGDYPYADGARCEGLLGAYELAQKMGDQSKMDQLWPALQLAAWSLLHLINTEDAIYCCPNPRLALGGIRFKYTRQWFRIDTIQHVASFFAKLLVHY